MYSFWRDTLYALRLPVSPAPAGLGACEVWLVLVSFRLAFMSFLIYPRRLRHSSIDMTASWPPLALPASRSHP